ncbi:MAG: 2-C-methyl-D-erythritol 2,4-cyclodiphosphate synthase [Melioribacteraceae bacterium]|nr:2-C-methyl-D-erythritol 2,4-cyclodiphosphate synthase [Melioribacteraceae bacterium]
MSFPFRIGSGYDVHQFVLGRKLFLGGVEIPHSKGFNGHSDADILLHALCDALLGALALGDIGKHFPNTDETYKNIDSKILLKKVNELIISHDYLIGNIDATIVMELPKIAPYIPQIQKVISEILSIDKHDISIKATTSERMGFIGREEGAEAFATVLIYKKEK